MSECSASVASWATRTFGEPAVPVVPAVPGALWSASGFNVAAGTGAHACVPSTAWSSAPPMGAASLTAAPAAGDMRPSGWPPEGGGACGTDERSGGSRKLPPPCEGTPLVGEGLCGDGALLFPGSCCCCWCDRTDCVAPPRSPAFIMVSATSRCAAGDRDGARMLAKARSGRTADSQVGRRFREARSASRCGMARHGVAGRGGAPLPWVAGGRDSAVSVSAKARGGGQEMRGQRGRERREDRGGRRVGGVL